MAGDSEQGVVIGTVARTAAGMAMLREFSLAELSRGTNAHRPPPGGDRLCVDRAVAAALQVLLVAVQTVHGDFWPNLSTCPGGQELSCF